MIQYCLLLVFSSQLVNAKEKSFDFFYDDLKIMNGSQNVLRLDLQISKVERGLFKITGEIDQLVELDNNWEVQYLLNYADERTNEYKNAMGLPKKGWCDMMKSYYKHFCYPIVKDYSNAPHYDTCPFPPQKYIIADLPFNITKYQSFFKVGYYQFVSLIHKANVFQAGFIVSGYVKD